MSSSSTNNLSEGGAHDDVGTIRAALSGKNLGVSDIVWNGEATAIFIHFLRDGVKDDIEQSLRGRHIQHKVVLQTDRHGVIELDLEQNAPAS